MKFSIVTPSHNKARFLLDAMTSVVSQQGAFQIEYLVVDNASSDGTRELLADFQQRLEAGELGINCSGVEFRYISEPDQGMYHAVNKGFALATGDIYAYLNADDLYLSGAFDAVARTFTRFDQISWLKGITDYVDEDGRKVQEGSCYLYHRPWIRQGLYGREAYFIQQDSVFWRASLWRRSGGGQARFRLAGDYYLWHAFAEYEPLYSLKLPVSCFRICKGQLSENSVAYQKECREIVPESGAMFRRLARMYFARHDKLPAALRRLMYRLLFGRQEFRLVEFDGGGKPRLVNTESYVV